MTEHVEAAIVEAVLGGHYELNQFSDIAGHTLTAVRRSGDNIELDLEIGGTVMLHHVQDCCEHVRIESLDGDLEDLVGTPIVFAEEAVNPPDAPKTEDSSYDSHHTWTFYRIGTIKGTVVIRWYGSSNGYYSESVSFVYENARKD